MFRGFKPRREKAPYCRHPLWARSVERTRKLSGPQLNDWGTAISGHAMRLLEQGQDGAEGLEDADELVLAGVSLVAIGLEQRRRRELRSGDLSAR
jgi:hypothetical protein